MGTVSVSGASNLDSLQHQLQQKAEQAGAKSIRIISAGGDNKMYGGG
ncbi:Multiple stress resistance protein BhsA precursor [Cedecea neteri]|uniref:Multiple stress resistance protein BhsA n=1 Tax=Cedecea neteri TaxID=158822 RepID=A0A2X2VB76_9ENTR|nr:Multiple stress resistance protein BhsA precursor [Cedecea neteri]